MDEKSLIDYREVLFGDSGSLGDLAMEKAIHALSPIKEIVIKDKIQSKMLDFLKDFEMLMEKYDAEIDLFERLRQVIFNVAINKGVFAETLPMPKKSRNITADTIKDARFAYKNLIERYKAFSDGSE